MRYVALIERWSAMLLVEISLSGCLSGVDPSFSPGEEIPNTADLNPPAATPTPSPDPDDDSSSTVPGPTYLTVSVSDSFPAENLQKQDFLFVIDDSGSMGDEIDTVEDNINNFIGALQSQRFVDYQAAVTTTDVRALRGQLITGNGGVSVINESMPLSTFESIIANVRARLNAPTATSWNEMGLLGGKAAIDAHGASFMRANVPLAVVIVSDEEDQSCFSLDGSGNCPNPNGYTAGQIQSNPLLVAAPVSDYVDYFKDLDTTVTVHPLVGLGNPLGSSTKKCAQIASIGNRYLDFSIGMGGDLLGSICAADLADDFVSIAEVLSARGICFHLDEDATGANISVDIGGTPVPADPVNGFVFDNATNSICFPGSFVDDGTSSINVTYDTVHVIP